MNDPSFARHFDDQNAVLRRQRDHQNEPDLRVEIVGDAEAGKRNDRTQQRQWHRREYRQWQDPAFVLAGETEIDEQHRQSEQIIELIAGQLFLIGHRGPLVGDVAQQISLRDPFQCFEALA